MTGNPDLIAEIRGEIGLRGPIPFARFMELALYHPHHGYYTSGRARIGKEGDFFTSPAVGPLFGRFLGMQFAEMWEIMGKPNPFTLLELGANRGWLKKDIVAWARERRPDFTDAMRYWTCERGAKDEAAAFADWDKIEAGSVSGCIFSNELADAFPVHRVCREGGAWQEQYVFDGRDHFEIQTGALSLPASSMPAQLTRAPFPEGYTTEIHAGCRAWIAAMARILERGFALTIDYGYFADEYYAPHRREGTLRCYRQHRASSDPLEHVGEQDITAHVNFSAVVEGGNEAGLSSVGFVDQSRFLVGVGQDEIERIITANPGHPDPIRQQLQTLLNPADMGTTFKILVQQKGVPNATLSGLKYSRRV